MSDAPELITFSGDELKDLKGACVVAAMKARMLIRDLEDDQSFISRRIADELREDAKHWLDLSDAIRRVLGR